MNLKKKYFVYFITDNGGGIKMFCRECGREFKSENSNVCDACGTQKGVGRNFCENCGAPLDSDALVCSNCGVRIENDIVVDATISEQNVVNGLDMNKNTEDNQEVVSDIQNNDETINEVNYEENHNMENNYGDPVNPQNMDYANNQEFVNNVDNSTLDMNKNDSLDMNKNNDQNQYAGEQSFDSNYNGSTSNEYNNQPMYNGAQDYNNQNYNNQGYNNQNYNANNYNPNNFNNQGYNGGQPIMDGYNQKSKIAAGLLGIFVGVFGVHNFYLGNTAKGLVQVLGSTIGGLCTCGIATIAIEIWALVEGIMILAGSINTDANGVPLKD